MGLVTHHECGILQRLTNILRLRIRMLRDDLLDSHVIGNEIDEVCHCYAHPTNAGASAQNFGVEHYSVEHNMLAFRKV